MKPRLVDMHCHLDRMANAQDVAHDAAEQGIAIFDTTVTPRDALRAQHELSGYANVRVGIGLHPWWLDDGHCDEEDIELVAQLAAKAPFVGEVGLDASKQHAHAHKRQLHAFESIVRAVAEHPLPHRVLSIHAVQSATQVLDILEKYELIGPLAPSGTSCIFHWFSGTSDELTRARRLGCHFSVNEHMLQTKRGREYARVVPHDRLLLETDAPPGLDTPYSAKELEASLERTLAIVAELRHANAHSLGESIAHTSQVLLGW